MATKQSKKSKSTKKRSATATEIKNQREREKQKSSGNLQTRAIILFAVAILSLFLIIIEGQSVWTALHNFLFGIFGICVYTVPVFLGAIAVFSAMEKFKETVTSKTVMCGLLVVFLQSAIDIFSAHPNGQNFWDHLVASYERGVSGGGGGFLGALIGEPIRLLCGTAGAGVIVCLTLFVLIMILTKTTLMGLFKTISKPAEIIERQVSESFEKVKEHIEENKKESQKDDEIKIDFSVDDIPENPIPPENIDEKGKRLIEVYHSEEIQDIDLSEENEEIEQNEKEETEDISELEKSVENEIIETAENEETEEYNYPPISLLRENSGRTAGTSGKELQATAENLVNVLRSFGVETRIVDVTRGPTVTRYELQPSAGVKISKITSLADDIALNLASGGVRIEAPIPNKAAIGIEVPNKSTAMVGVRDIIDTEEFASAKSKLTAALGKDISGKSILTDISKMPHGLIAGSTGSGKSVCINSIIISLLYKANPDEVKLLMIDPKVVELGVYNGIPHLLVPVVTDPRRAAGALGWAVQEMEKRYRLFAECNVRNLEGYNHLAEMSEDLPKMPRIVIIIDELADLMATSSKEVEDYIGRITAKARAAGMHLIVATQRPSVDVVTGVIKNNIPTRIAFAVSSQTDSRTIIDMGGAERLLGKGDMLYCPFGANKPTRIQGCFVSEDEVEKVVEFIKSGQTCEYDEDISEEIERMAVSGNKDKSRAEDSSVSDRDPMIYQAIECVIDAGRASASHLQSRLKLGYARASRIINEMEEMGIIGPYEGAKPRQVLITKTEFLEMQSRNNDEV